MDKFISFPVSYSPQPSVSSRSHSGSLLVLLSLLVHEGRALTPWFGNHQVRNKDSISPVHFVSCVLLASTFCSILLALSVCPNRLNHPASQPSDSSSSPTVTANLNSLIKHKAFVSSMMSEPNSLQSFHSNALHPLYLLPPDPVITSKSRLQSSQSFVD
ncbi:hypothetical protein PGT21_018038 [Puccinia graminis f. sp. tritici]|uniref:Uncharacterized protein n=1 Tax=Puccinia graminis f. sp. tritici TaxID=56615 RepID=A0A5B0NLD7_PUCGR|nr:hypothetical protein PGT21_018038 [Puccinia graminis f. sp. tritici]